MSTTSSRRGAQVGVLLRDWRRRRRLSQLSLALDAGVSTRHLSFVETGRSRPSEAMVLRLAERLDVPSRERNRLLMAAGYAPVHQERSLDEPDLEPVHAALRAVLDGHDPSPAIAVDRGWALVARNRAANLNVLRASLHPDGLAPRIANLRQWRAHVLGRLAREAALTGDPSLRALHRELEAYPAPDADDPGSVDLPNTDVAVPLRVRTPAGELRFLNTVTAFGTPVDIAVEEVSIETFLPADRFTVDTLRRHAAAA
jgi:transcriptional regulator with XRE-family HTH domain